MDGSLKSSTWRLFANGLIYDSNLLILASDAQIARHHERRISSVQQGRSVSVSHYGLDEISPRDSGDTNRLKFAYFAAPQASGNKLA